MQFKVFKKYYEYNCEMNNEHSQLLNFESNMSKYHRPLDPLVAVAPLPTLPCLLLQRCCCCCCCCCCCSLLLIADCLCFRDFLLLVAALRNAGLATRSRPKWTAPMRLHLRQKRQLLHMLQAHGVAWRGFKAWIQI